MPNGHRLNPQLLAQTFTGSLSIVQHENQPAVLKLLTPIGVSDEQSGAAALAFTFAYACLSAAWSLEDGNEEKDAIAELIQSHLNVPD